MDSNSKAGSMDAGNTRHRMGGTESSVRMDIRRR